MWDELAGSGRAGQRSWKVPRKVLSKGSARFAVRCFREGEGSGRAPEKFPKVEKKRSVQ